MAIIVFLNTSLLIRIKSFNGYFFSIQTINYIGIRSHESIINIQYLHHPIIEIKYIKMQ